MPKQAKRRFVGLDTDEVSLVDTPANEVEFLVTKNQEDEEMGAAQAAQTTNDSPVRVPVEVSDGEAVAKAMEHVNGIVGNIMKLVAKNAPKSDEATETSETTEVVDAEKATIKSVLAAMGLTGKAMDEAMAKLKKAGFDGNMKFPSAKAPVTKAAGDDEESTETEEQVVSVDDMPLTIGAIQKAAAFTPTRITQLKTAVDTLKLILESIGVGQAPATRVPGVQTHPNTSQVNDLAAPKKAPVMKSADGNTNELLDVLKSLGGAVEKLGERVESIEKARQGSNSVEDDANTNDTDNVQTKKSIWSGVL